MGRRHGLSDEKLRGLGDFESSAVYSDLERLVLRYAVAMTKTPVHVPDDLFEALRERLNPAQMVELTSAIAWENYRARFGHAFELDAAGFSEGAFCPLPASA